MVKLILWVGMTTGSVIFHVAMAAFGDPFDAKAFFSSTFWSGATLLLYHLICVVFDGEAKP